MATLSRVPSYDAILLQLHECELIHSYRHDSAKKLSSEINPSFDNNIPAIRAENSQSRRLQIEDNTENSSLKDSSGNQPRVS